MRRLLAFPRLLALTWCSALLVFGILGYQGDGWKRLSPGELASLRGATQYLCTLKNQTCTVYNASQTNGTAVPGIPGSGGTKTYYSSDQCGTNQNSPCIFCGDSTKAADDPQPTSPNNQVLSSTSGSACGLQDTTSVSCGKMSYGTCALYPSGTSFCSITSPDAAECGNANHAAADLPTKYLLARNST